MQYTLDYLDNHLDEIFESIDYYDKGTDFDLDDDRMIVSDWYIYIPKLDLSIRSGIVCCLYGTEYEPDFDISVIYEGDIKDSLDENDYIYYEQDGIVTSLYNYLTATGKDTSNIGSLQCQLHIPQTN